MYVSPDVEKLYGINRDTIYQGHEHLFFDVILDDEKPAVIEFANGLWDDPYQRGKKYISGRVFTIEYRILNANGDILLITHQIEVFTFTKDELLKTIIARFIDMSWLCSDNKDRVVKFYIYNKNSNEIEHCVEKKVSLHPAERLTPREEEVQNLIDNGFTSNQIAEKLDISFETVKTHRRNIKAKQADA